MKQRLEQFLKAENISQAQFAESINVTRAGISHILSGRNKPSYEFIINTINAFPHLNIEWLLTGKGKMFKNSEESKESEPLLFSEPQQTPTSIAAPVAKPQQKSRHIFKIVALYEDNTFDEFTSEK